MGVRRLPHALRLGLSFAAKAALGRPGFRLAAGLGIFMDDISQTASLDSEGRIRLSDQVIRALGAKPGDKLSIDLCGGVMVLSRVVIQPKESEIGAFLDSVMRAAERSSISTKDGTVVIDGESWSVGMADVFSDKAAA